MRGRYYQIITVCPTEAEARRIARKLVELRLVACAQVGGPVQSNYWWEGKVEEATEWVCILKAPASNYVRIESEIKRMHSYRVPEVLALPVKAGNDEYLEWLGKEAVPATAEDSLPQGDCADRNARRAQVE